MLKFLSKSNQYNGVDIMGSWVEIGMVVTALIVGAFIMIPAVKAFLRSRNTLYPCSPKFRTMHSQIHEFLTELRVKLNADRGLIIQFHNGGQFLDGSSVKRFSLTHESCVVGTSESMGQRQNLLASTFTDLLDHLSKDSPVIEVTSNLSDSHFKRHLESNHTLVFSLVPIKDVRGVLVTGFLLVEWCNWDNADLIDDDKVMIDIPQYVRYIEGQLYSGGGFKR
tara:strand:+ start:60 stop:728 length:669 start_codon:yes stop_codon:yes gene_type:complete